MFRLAIFCRLYVVTNLMSSYKSLAFRWISFIGKYDIFHQERKRRRNERRCKAASMIINDLTGDLYVTISDKISSICEFSILNVSTEKNIERKCLFYQLAFTGCSTAREIFFFFFTETNSAALFSYHYLQYTVKT